MQKNSPTANDLSNANVEGETDSLIDEPVCEYKLRSYDNIEYNQSNWIETPILSPDTKIELSTEQCEETFKLFLLSGLRLSQMTKTYHDIDAVMHLLKEKERDLELAARIGQTLLGKNKEVAQQNDLLEEKLAYALEEASQLRHEVGRKEELLRFYADTETDSNGSASPMKDMKVDCLHDKIQQLEKDKNNLMEEKSLIYAQSEEIKEKEHELVSSAVQQLNILQDDLQTANTQILAVTDELSKRNNESSHQQQEISVLLDQVVELQKKHTQLMTEHEDLQLHLSAANKSQYNLSQDVHDLECKYREVLNMLDDTREEMRMFRDSSLHLDTDLFDHNLPNSWQIPFQDSLAAELEVSDNGWSDHNDSHTLSIPSRLVKPLDASTSMYTHKTLTSEKSGNTTVEGTAKRKLQLSKRLYSTPSSSNQNFKLHRDKTRWIVGSPPASGLLSPGMGQPGVPGTADLERAIEKLTRFGKESLKFVEKTKQMLQSGQNLQPGYMKKCFSAPKLRIVKPLEGSSTLHTWKSLADHNSELSSLVKCPVQSPGIVIRNRLSRDQAVAEQTLDTPTGNSSKTLSRELTNNYFSKSMLSISGSSGTIVSAPQQAESQLALKSVKSSPHLLSLAAVLAPVSNAQCSSIIHAVSKSSANHQPDKNSESELAQLHGSNNL